MRYILLLAAATIFGGCVNEPNLPVLGPNLTAKHEKNLQHSIDRAIDRQEKEDRLDQLLYIK